MIKRGRFELQQPDWKLQYNKEFDEEEGRIMYKFCVNKRYNQADKDLAVTMN